MENQIMQIFNYTTTTPLSKAVMERRAIISEKIDEYANTTDSLEMLSVACGHMREVKISDCFKNNKFKRCVGFDQDEESLRTIREEYSNINIECVQGDIFELAMGEVNLGTFDLIYAAGLYDYLPQPLGKRLTKSMFKMLKPGGKIIIGNFIQNPNDIGYKLYTEIMMDWKLVYRTIEEMEGLAGRIAKNEIGEKKVFLENNKHVAFLEITKK